MSVWHFINIWSKFNKIQVICGFVEYQWLLLQSLTFELE